MITPLMLTQYFKYLSVQYQNIFKDKIKEINTVDMEGNFFNAGGRAKKVQLRFTLIKMTLVN